MIKPFAKTLGKDLGRAALLALAATIATLA